MHLGCMLLLKLVYFDQVSFVTSNTFHAPLSGLTLGRWGEKEFKEMKSETDKVSGYDSKNVVVLMGDGAGSESKCGEGVSGGDDVSRGEDLNVGEMKDDVKTTKDKIKCMEEEV